MHTHIYTHINIHTYGYTYIHITQQMVYSWHCVHDGTFMTDALLVVGWSCLACK